MAGPDGSKRPWRQIAKELSEEADPERVLALSIELNTALETQGVDVTGAALPVTGLKPPDAQ